MLKLFYELGPDVQTTHGVPTNLKIYSLKFTMQTEWKNVLDIRIEDNE